MTALAFIASAHCLVLLLRNGCTLKGWRRSIELNQRILDENRRILEERAEELREAYQSGVCAGVGLEVAREVDDEDGPCTCEACRRERFAIN